MSYRFITTLCWALLVIGLGLFSPISGAKDSRPLEMVTIGPDSKTWARMKAASGSPASAAQESPDSSGAIVEIETGMNFWDGAAWVPSDATFSLTEDAFVADQMQHKVKLSAELNLSSSVTVTTRDNHTLKSTPVAIGLYDAESGK